jgi:hypothetical protein
LILPTVLPVAVAMWPGTSPVALICVGLISD